jgi:hypothetical protein
VHNLFGLAHYISLEGLRTEVENDKGRYHTLTDMAFEQPFSKRNRYSGAAKEITIREDAPENLRYVVLQTAVDLGWAPSSLRTIICRVLRVPPDGNRKAGDKPNVRSFVTRNQR